MGTTESITFYIVAALIGALLVFAGAYVGYWKGRMDAFDAATIGCDKREYLESIRPKFIAGDRVRCHMAPLDEVYTIKDSCRVGDKWIYDIGDGCGLDYDEEDIDHEPVHKEESAKP